MVSSSSRARSVAAALVLALCLVGTIVPTVSAQSATGRPTATPATAAPGPAEIRAWLALLVQSSRPSCAGTHTSDGSVPPHGEPTLAQLVGQKLMVRMAGRRPSRALLARVRRGEIGGVVLLASNITTRAALIELTRSLQQAAAAGGQPPLLIALDQEGGSVKRVPWAPPT